jgi:hypothetical protein
VNRCERKVLGILIDALINVFGAGLAEAFYGIVLADIILADVTQEHLFLGKYLGFHLRQGNRHCPCRGRRKARVGKLGRHRWFEGGTSIHHPPPVQFLENPLYKRAHNKK